MPSRKKAPSITGLLLAGGKSRRFGSDKALAILDGQPLIAHAYAALAPRCMEILVGVDEPGRAYPLPGPARTVVDAVPGIGPLGGLLAGLTEARTEWLLALACDLPWVSADHLTVLTRARSDAADAVVVQDGDRLQPLCALYQVERTRRAAEAQVATGRYALHAVLGRLAVRTVAMPPGVLRNVNTRADLTDGTR